MNIILCKKARSITWLDFWLRSLKNHTFTLNTKVKIDIHLEQCNVVVIIKYEIKSMKTLEDTISYSWLVLDTGTLPAHLAIP